MSRNYELMVILSPEVVPDAVPDRMAALGDLIREHGGSVHEVIDWGRRRLAYPVKRQLEGHYILAQYSADAGEANLEVERSLRIDESVLRHLVVRQDD